MKKIELLSPAGDMSKLKTALYFGADAVYIGGKQFSLRALAGNFSNEEILEAVSYTHALNKKIYVTVNIFGRNDDIESAEEYFKFLESANIDGAIISDPGLIYLARQVAPKLPINVSTQANTLNYKTVEFWKTQGVKRVILARELSLNEIGQIHLKVPEIEIETFIHGAMCISYSGRCLLSDYRTGRSSNRGECVQACRWNYEIREKGSDCGFMEMQEDERGTYIMNSKDLNLLDYIAELDGAGVCSFKIEGRMKSEYYLATVVNAYRRALDAYYECGRDYKNNALYQTELKKTAHREFTTAYLLGENNRTVNYSDSQSKGTHKFIASVVEGNDGKDYAVVEMRNRFKVSDKLEVLSPTNSFNKIIQVEKLEDEKGNIVEDAKIVQQKLKLFTSVPLKAGDVLRIEN
ncbi:MAG: U32 family peptidase [Clostridiales bacterium]|nr:U32 family peptidase [Clostridiales bacterium]